MEPEIFRQIARMREQEQEVLRKAVAAPYEPMLRMAREQHRLYERLTAKPGFLQAMEVAAENPLTKVLADQAEAQHRIFTALLGRSEVAAALSDWSGEPSPAVAEQVSDFEDELAGQVDADSPDDDEARIVGALQRLLGTRQGILAMISFLLSGAAAIEPSQLVTLICFYMATTHMIGIITGADRDGE